MEAILNLYKKINLEENTKLKNYLIWLFVFIINIFVFFIFFRNREITFQNQKIQNPLSPSTRRKYLVKNPRRIYQERSPVKTMRTTQRALKKNTPRKIQPRFRISDFID